MKRIIALSSVILIGIFVTSNPALAQAPNYPYQQPYSDAQNIPPESQLLPQEDTQIQPQAEEPPADSQIQPQVAEPQAEEPTGDFQSQPQVAEPQAEEPTETSSASGTSVSGAESTGISTDQPSVPQSNPYYLYFIYFAAAALAVTVLFWLWFKKWREMWKGKKKTDLPAEAEEGTVPCPTCGGTGKVSKKRTSFAPCGHCKQKGIDSCHYCGGTGRNGLGYGVPMEDIENYPKCDYCGGKGFPKIPLACCMCKGERKIAFEESYEATCPTCSGRGFVKK